MNHTLYHFGVTSQIRPTDDLFQLVESIKPEALEQIPVPEATESDWAAFDELRGKP